jgi:hypothetical protein
MLLEAPNPKDPQDAEVAKMMMEDHEFFSCVAHDWAVKHAGAPRTQPPPDQLQRKATQKKEDDIAKYAETTSPVSLPVVSRILPFENIVLTRSYLAKSDIKAGTRT